MGSTRQHSHLTPIKIFNDSFGTDQQSQLNLSSPLDNAPSLQPAGNVLGPKRDTNNKIIPSSQSGRSPSKPGHTSSPPLKHVLTSAPTVSFPTPKTGHGTDSLIKKPSPASYQSIAPHMSQLNSSGGGRRGGSSVMFPSSGGIDKENAPYNSSDNFTEFPGPEYAPKGLNKRPLASSNAHEERSSKAPRLAAPTRIPEPHEMPEIADDGRKPRYTYAQLCAMAILRSPQRKLTLASIYEWIHNTFAFYREATASGWQNSIRHNLSLHKAFSKVERPRNDPGKGNYWIIEQDMIADFLEEKTSRRPASSSTSHRPSSRPSSSHGPPLPGPILAPMQPPAQQQQQPQQSQIKQLQQQQAQEQEIPGRQPMQPPPSRRMSTSAGSQSQQQSSKPQAAPIATAAEPSSDATIPLSDPALLVEDGEDAWVDIARPSSRARQSSPQPPMHSSPPVAHLRSRASTGVGNDLLSSTHGSKKRKRVSMNDSGYYSSLESSAMRRPHSRAGLDSLASNRKRGRAEEEIARLRSSSQDISPSKPPYLGVPRHSTPGLLSSSPTRPTDRPLTPGIGLSKTTKLRKPKLSAPTLSPDTQLANHRNKVNQLFGTPLKGEANGLIADFMTPQSQSFNLLDDPFDVSNLSPGIRFDVFEDQSPLKRRALAARSPEKLRSASRPGLSRSNTTPARALGDVTRTASNRPSPLGLKPPVKLMSRLGSPLRFTSPEKPSNPTPAALAANDNITLTSSPINNSFASIFGAACKSPVKLGSPFSKQLEELYFGDAAKAFDFSTTEPDTFFDMFADEKNASPIDGSCPETGFDLAGDFRKISGGVGDTEAFNDKENTVQQQQQPAKRQRVSPTKSRPSLGGRSSTSFM